MDEFKFVAKCLLITVVVMFALQFEIGGKRGEAYVANYLRQGTAVVWVRESLKGAHMFIVKNSTELAPKIKTGSWMPSFGSDTGRHTSTDVPATEFPEETVGDEAAHKASAF